MTNRGNEVAIVGMSCIFPGAHDVDSFWKNILNGVDAIDEAPASRIDPVFFDSSSSSPDRLYCRRGGFIDRHASFDPLRFGVMPVAAQTIEAEQLVILELATAALANAGYATRPFARSRTGVILGRGNYRSAATTRYDQFIRGAEQYISAIRSVVPTLTDAAAAELRKRFQESVGPLGVDAAFGIVPNLVASRVSNRLDFHGPAFTIDAACASSLVAIDQACAELASGRCDVVLAGGVHLCNEEMFWSVFCQLGALSRNEQIRPLDARADGLVIGEGAGLVMLKRLADAERDGDRVYAVIRGVAVGSDGRDASLMTPRVEGQVDVLERAWQMAQLDRRAVGLVEAHGTATPAGDAAELETLARFFGTAAKDEPRSVVGSVKSMIGHTMPAAGIAGLIKAALSVYHGVLPPTLHCEQPNQALEKTRFRVINKTEPWPERSARYAAVNAFGFGGINAHVVIEAHEPSVARAALSHSLAPKETPASHQLEPFALFAADTSERLIEELSKWTPTERATAALIGSFRCAVMSPTPERIERAKDVVALGHAWRGREGIFFSSDAVLSNGGKLAFVFPGVDALFEPRVDDVAAAWSVPPPMRASQSNLEEVGVGIVAVNRLLARALHDIDIFPDAICGHSIGEWSAMIASGMVSDSATDALLQTLRPGSLRVPGVVFAAVGTSVDRAKRAIDDLPDIVVSHDNCPHQVILCGREASIDIALDRLRDSSVLCAKLPFQSGFHSPLFADYVAPHREHFASIPLNDPHCAIWSATICSPFPRDPRTVRDLAIRHLTEPVRFRELIDNMYADGVRAFVQVGTGSVVNFIDDTLRGKAHLAVSANTKNQSGLSQLLRVALSLFVEGGSATSAERLQAKCAAREVPSSSKPMIISLGFPIVRPQPHPAIAVTAAPGAPSRPPMSTHRYAASFAATLDDIAAAQAEVLARFDEHEARRALAPSQASASQAIASQPTTPTRTDIRTLSVKTFPELIDHSFYRQKANWPILVDVYPVVPMTMSIALMIDAAEKLLPGHVAVAIENVRAFRWLAVAPPVDVSISTRLVNKNTVDVSIDGYIDARVELAPKYTAPPRASLPPLLDPCESEVTARALYEERRMFHGPAYQGVTKIGQMGSNGIEGEIEAGAATGALLDNAGQLFGFWVHETTDTKKTAMPVKIGRIDFYGAHPKPGERLSCDVRIMKHNLNEVVANVTLARNGALWANIRDWEDRRFDTDDRLSAVSRFPETNTLSLVHDQGFAIFNDRYTSAPTRDQLSRRYLTQSERDHYGLQPPRNQRIWLDRRIAAKDVARSFLWKRGAGPLFPAEIVIEDTSDGTAIAHAPNGITVRVATANKGTVIVAIATDRKTARVGIEAIEPKVDSATSTDNFKERWASTSRCGDFLIGWVLL